MKRGLVAIVGGLLWLSGSAWSAWAASDISGFHRNLPPAPMPPAAVGSYAKGCLAGAEALPADGPAWQAMRPSRKRHFGHPRLVAFIEDLSVRAQAVGWPGLLVGDMAQSRGGPMNGGHRSHQIGLDVDIWLTPMPSRLLSDKEREETSAVNMVAENRLTVRADRWSAAHMGLIKTAAQSPDVARIFVNAAIKKEMCRTAGDDRGWLRKIRPWWGHDHHFHVRLSCPPGDKGCKNQAPPAAGDGCDATLEWWFSDEALNPKPSGKPRKKLTLASLPAQCRKVLEAQ